MYLNISIHRKGTVKIQHKRQCCARTRTHRRWGSRRRAVDGGTLRGRTDPRERTGEREGEGRREGGQRSKETLRDKA